MRTRERWCRLRSSKSLPERYSTESRINKDLGVRGRLIAVCGPTGSGKSRVALQEIPRAGADVEIINADAFQIYTGMDIGTAKPTDEERSAIPHHLIDIRSPLSPYSVADFVRDAENALSSVWTRGKLPVFVGGTVFYLKHLFFGLPETPPSDQRIRQELERRLAVEGLGPLRAELERVDPESCERIGERDGYRTLRALEIFAITGRPRSSFPAAASIRSDRDIFLIGLRRDREDLYRRIELRTKMMFDSGLPEELQKLSAQGCTGSSPGMRAIGYREFFDPNDPSRLLDIGDRVLLDEVRNRIAMHTRNYAKRQMTFLRSLPGIRWFDAEPCRVAEDVPDTTGCARTDEACVAADGGEFPGLVREVARWINHGRYEK